MATTEEKVDKFEIRFSTLEQQVSTIAAKVDMLVVESQQQREDIRRLQERQDAMQVKHDAEMKAMQEKQDVKMHEMNQRFYDKVDANAKEFTNQLHSNFVQTMIGIAVIMAAIGGLIIATLK